MEMQSPILIIGDIHLSKNVIVSAKKKYRSVQWETVSATNQTPDEIRMISGFNGFISSEQKDKIILIQDIPNKKQVREFIVDLVKSSSEHLKFVIWDSLGHIKIDPKTREINKTWVDFVQLIKHLPDSKIIDNGFDFTEKENIDCIKYIHDCFGKYNKKIQDKAAIVFIDIVGKNRGLILSEVQKISLNSPDVITPEFITENAFPTSNESALYKFGNAIDTGNLPNAINSLEDFMSHGVSPYILTEILVKKARWQLVVSHLWNNNIQWMDIPDIIMDMGKFPSKIWHDGGMSVFEKRKKTEDFDTGTSRIRFMSDDLGIPLSYFVNEVKESKKKKKKDDSGDKSEKTDKPAVINGECIPLRFIAQQIVDSVHSVVVEPNKNKFKNEEIREKVFNRCLFSYLRILDLMKDIRYNSKDTVNSLYEMIKILTNHELDVSEIIE